MTPNLLTIAGSDPERRGRDPGRPEDVLGARRVRHERADRAHLAEHTRCPIGARGPGRVRTEQLDAVFDDVRVDAVKIGMLATADVIDAVASVLDERRPPYVVLDPVMVANSGDRLLAADAVARLRDVLLPLVDLITPNLPEAADLLGVPEAHDEAEMREQLDSLRKLGPACCSRAVTSAARSARTCSHRRRRTRMAQREPTRLVARRIETTSDHGTGCTLSSAIAALRPQRDSWLAAVTDAKAYLTLALAGRGPPGRRRRSRPGAPLPLLVVTSAIGESGNDGGRACCNGGSGRADAGQTGSTR